MILETVLLQKHDSLGLVYHQPEMANAKRITVWQHLAIDVNTTQPASIMTYKCLSG